MEIWDISVDSLLLISGFSEICQGQCLPIAPKFFYDKISFTKRGQKGVRRTRGRLRPYRVIAEIAEIGERGWVIDFGIRAYQTRPLPHGAAIGLFVTADVLLGVGNDEYYVRDTLDFSAIYRRWQIETITKEVAPLIPVLDENGRQKYRTGDRARMTHEIVERTDSDSEAARLEDAMTSYILHCRLIDN